MVHLDLALAIVSHVDVVGKKSYGVLGKARNEGWKNKADGNWCQGLNLRESSFASLFLDFRLRKTPACCELQYMGFHPLSLSLTHSLTLSLSISLSLSPSHSISACLVALVFSFSVPEHEFV